MVTIPQLHVEWDALAIGPNLLVCIYDAGDCDVIPWPFRRPEDARNLRSCLYDAREMGLVPIDTEVVRLPDGTLFAIAEPRDPVEEESYEDYCARREWEEERTFALQHGCVNRL